MIQPRCHLTALVWLGASLVTACAGSLGSPEPAGVAAETGTDATADEHLAALEAIPLAAVRLIEGPTLALEHWEYLDLSVDQLRRLEDLEFRVERERQTLLTRIDSTRQELSVATEGLFDEARIRAVLARLGDARTEASLLSLRVRGQTLALLTEEQASLLTGYAREHIHMMMMGWVTEVCTGPSGMDALVSDVTGAITPCIAMPEETEDQVGEPRAPHVH